MNFGAIARQILCQFNRQLSTNVFKLLSMIILFTYSLNLSALVPAKSKDNTEILRALNPYYVINDRGPANFIPHDEFEVPPYLDNERQFGNKLVVEDDGGILRKVKRDMSKWSKTEEFAKNWNVESTGVYEVPTVDARKSYLQKNALKYADKRLSGEIKKAEPGSTLATVGEAKEYLRPQTKVSLTKKVKVKFKARVLQGHAKMIIDNPYVENEVKVGLNGKMKINMKKELEKIKVVTNLEYRLADDQWVAFVDKGLTDNLDARISSTQTHNEMMFSNKSDRKIELIYSTDF